MRLAMVLLNTIQQYYMPTIEIVQIPPVSVLKIEFGKTQIMQ